MGSYDDTPDENRSSGQELAEGYRLDDYVIEKCVGAGGFGVTYLGRDVNLDKRVAIKEYFPFHLAFRGDESRVAPRTRAAQDLDEYKWGLDRFIDEARALGKFEHPNVVRVIRYMERNDTAYIAMEFVEGAELKDIIQERGPLSGEETRNIIVPLMSGLIAVHEKGILHRDIKPENIIIRKDGSPVLIDFGAARQAIGARSKSLSAILTPGYAPVEQYETRGNQGPWTDIYALGAVGYACLLAQKPEEATKRFRGDPNPPLAEAAKDRADPAFLHALDWAMRPNEHDRPQTVEEWRDAVNQGSAPSSSPGQGAGAFASAPTIKATEHNEAASLTGDGKNNGLPLPLLVGGVAAAVVIGAAALLFLPNSGDKVTKVNAPETRQVADPEPQEPDVVIEQPAQTAPQQQPAQGETTKARQESRDFQTAELIGTAEGYQIFLMRHPDGANAQTARQRLNELRAQQRTPRRTR
ncbi:MAG: serine/threonine-protein kinase [Pseudomonadota bacterium]